MHSGGTIAVDGMNATYGLRFGVATANVDIVKALIDTADPAGQDSCALRYAASNGFVDIVRRVLLADGRADPNARRSEALWTAANEGRVGVVRALLVDGRCDPCAGGNHALRCAMDRGHAAVVRALIADGRADPTQLVTAAGFTVKALALLPQLRAEVRWRRRRGWLLHAART